MLGYIENMSKHSIIESLQIFPYLFFSLANISQYFVQVWLAYYSTHAGLLQEWVSYLDSFSPSHHLLQKLRHDLPLNKHSSSIAANLKDRGGVCNAS